jgi:hypothetical protein
MFGNNAQVNEAAAEFAGTFGLRGFPGKTGFYVNRGQSYVSGGIVQLYVFDGNGRAFAKATPNELRAQIVGRIEAEG